MNFASKSAQAASLATGLAAGFAVLASVPALPGQDGPVGLDREFIRGDANSDGRVTIQDGLFVLEGQFRGGALPRCEDAADFNDDGGVDLGDVVFFLNWFSGDIPVLPAPFPQKGVDPTGDRIGCVSSSVTPPAIDPRFRMEWNQPLKVSQGQKNVEAFLGATTAGPTGCFSIAYRTSAAHIENLRADFEGTVFPPDRRASFESSAFFLVEDLPLKDPGSRLFRVQAIFDDPPGQQVPFAATQRALAAEPLLRLVFDVRVDAPAGAKIAVLTPAVEADLDPLRPAGLNEYCFEAKAVFPGAVGLVTLGIERQALPELVRGDANLSGRVSPIDATFILEVLFLSPGGSLDDFRCKDAADVNDDGDITVSDALVLLNFIFGGGATPSPPFPGPGVDPTVLDALDCAESNVVPPSLDPRYATAWQNEPAALQGMRDFELFLLATTDAPIECFSIAMRVDRRAAVNVRVDLAGTVFPAEKRDAFEASSFFGYELVPIDAQFDLLKAGATFVELEGPGFRAIDFAATQRPLMAEKLLRILFDVPEDAPVGPVVFLDPVPLSEVPPEEGLYNEFCRREPAPPAEDDLDGRGAGAEGTEIGGVLPEAEPGGGAIVDGEEYLRGDANWDEKLDLSDAVKIFGFLFLNAPKPVCCDAADTNTSGALDISDGIYLLNFLFSSGPPPSWPFEVAPGGTYLGGLAPNESIENCDPPGFAGPCGE